MANINNQYVKWKAFTLVVMSLCAVAGITGSVMIKYMDGQALSTRLLLEKHVTLCKESRAETKQMIEGLMRGVHRLEISNNLIIYRLDKLDNHSEGPKIDNP